MANPARGEVSFKALGESYTFLFGFNAICAAEDDFDQPFVEIVGEILPGAAGDLASNPDAAKEAAKRMRFGNIRRMIRFGLVQHHPGITDLEVGEIIDEIGLPKATEILGRGLALALGGDDEDGGESGDGNPRRPRPRK